PEALEEVLPKAVALHPPLEGLEPVASYAGLRPAGRGVNYVIRHSRARVDLVHVAAIRSTGLTAALGIAEHVADMIAPGRADAPLLAGDPTPSGEPWWRRAAGESAQWPAR